MAIRIDDVKITTDYSWVDINNLSNWNAIRTNHNDWQQLYSQTTKVGSPIKIEVTISEDNWLNIRETLYSWLDVRNRFANWLEVKNH